MPITYPTLQTLITNLHNAIITASAGTVSDTSHMHEQERILIGALNLLKAHVEFVANNAADPGTVITSAGMSVIINGGANGVSELTLDAIGNGSLQVRVPRQTGDKAFAFEYSSNGTTWQEFTCSSLTKVTLSNQPLGSTVYIRYAAISKTGKGAYSQVKNAIIV